MTFLKRLRGTLCYDQRSGVFTWRRKPSFSVEIGTRAGSVGRRGYRYIRVYGHRYLAHRLAWFYTTGKWPRSEIDHINGLPDDNRFINLRDVAPSLNQQNRKRAQINNKTGFLGVRQIGRRFQAGIRLNYKSIHIGMFATAQLAHKAYLSTKRRIHEGNTL